MGPHPLHCSNGAIGQTLCQQALIEQWSARVPVLAQIFPKLSGCSR